MAFYPSVFSPLDTDHNRRGANSSSAVPVIMQHFVAYCQGAAGIVPPAETQRQDPKVKTDDSAAATTRWLTFYDLQPDKQHGILNLAFDGGRNGGAVDSTQCVKGVVSNTSRLIQAWEQHQMPGLLDLECLGGDMGHGLYLRNASFECPSCPACSVCPIGSAVYLNPHWKQLLTTVLTSAMSYLKIGAIRGVSLGDEPCCGGLAVSNLSAVADFVKDMIAHTGAFIYVNECGRTFMGLYNNGTDGMYPGMMTKENKVPASIDIISADTYTLPQFEANMDRRLYNGWSEFHGGGVYPALWPHQRVFVVPGLFADATKPRNESETLLLTCLEGFWQWVQNDTKVVGINAWHWNT